MLLHLPSAAHIQWHGVRALLNLLLLFLLLLLLLLRTCDESPVHPIRFDHDEAQLLTGKGARGTISQGRRGKACSRGYVSIKHAQAHTEGMQAGIR
jgi:hypothetical protein